MTSLAEAESKYGHVVQSAGGQMTTSLFCPCHPFQRAGTIDRGLAAQIV
jgi:hypothetical protein